MAGPDTIRKYLQDALTELDRYNEQVANNETALQRQIKKIGDDQLARARAAEKDDPEYNPVPGVRVSDETKRGSEAYRGSETDPYLAPKTTPAAAAAKPTAKT